MSFAGIILLVLLIFAIAAVAGTANRRPGIVAGIAGLGAVGLLLIVLIYFWRGAAVSYQEAPAAVMWSDSHGAMSVNWPDGSFHAMTPSDAHAEWRFAIWPKLLLVLLLAGGVGAVVLFTSLRRPGGAACAVSTHRGWWPAAMLLLLLPIGFFFVVARTDVQQQRQASIWQAEMHRSQIHERVARRQAELERRQAEIARQTSQLTSELEHRIETMDIHRLMDLVDAPRIMLPIPTPAAIAQWAQVAGALEDSAEEKAEVQAEAEAAVKVISAEDEAAPFESTEPIGEAESANRGSASTVVANHGADDRRGRGGHTAQRGRGSLAPTAEPRPDWVGRTPKRVGNVRRDVIVTDEYSSREECEWAADRLLQLKTYEHLQRLVGKPLDANDLLNLRNEALSIEGYTPRFLYELEKAGITIDYIHHEIAYDEYLEEVERSFGKMLKLYTPVEFTPAVDNELRQRWQASQRQERFAIVGLGASSVLGLLGLAWGLLKIDTWTKGYYTKRLFIGVPLGILGLYGLLVLFMETIGGH